MKLKKIIVAAMVGGAFFACNCNDSYCSAADVMTEFKAAYVASPVDNRVIKGGFNCFGPYFHMDADASGQMLSNGSIVWDGKINWIFTDKKTMQSSNENIPVYLEQKNGSMTLFVYRNHAWSKFMLPGIPVELIAAIKSADTSVLANNLTAVKRVEELEASGNQQKVRVTLDGKKLAGLMDSYVKNASGEQALFMSRLKTAFNKTDVVVDWDYNANTKETVTISANLTPVIREYAKGVIDEMAAGKIKLSDEDKNYYATLGYYAEFPVYMSMSRDSAPMPPQGIDAAQTNDAVFADIKKGIASTAQK